MYGRIVCIIVTLHDILTTNEVRKKRKRYRDNKKRRFSSWKKRKEDYERAVQVEISEAAIAETQKEQQALLQENKRNIENMKTVLHCQEEFSSLESNSNSLTANSDVLLLPTQESNQCRKRQLEVDQSVYIKQLENDRDQAIQNARLYRDLAERSKSEKRHLYNEMCRKVEVVRHNYRNKIIESHRIIECGSRSGQIVHMAMKANCNNSPDSCVHVLRAFS